MNTKAKYVKPVSTTINMFFEDAILGTSNLGKNDGGDNGGSEALSGQGGWSSDNWTGSTEE